MRKPLFQKAVRGREVSNTLSIPAPVGGWNARDSEANMPPLDATILINWFCETTDIRVRRGFASHVTGITGDIESLMVYNKSDGTQTMFAAAGTVFKDVTSSGAVGGDVQTGLSNARWQSVNFTNSGGTSYLCNFNGEDAPRYWNGSTWITITGGSSPAITGITTTTIINAEVHKRRMWLVVTDSLKAYYLPVDSVGGAVNFISLGGIAKKGGFIMSIGTWTLDAGEGADDYWVAYTSEGQVVVYRGTDPTSSSTWTLHGVWNIGEPIGRRCLIKRNADLEMLSVSGIIPLSKLLLSTSVEPVVATTDKINHAMTEASVEHRDKFGWVMLDYSQANMLLLNVPVSEGSKQEQYVMNTITGAWSRFEGMPANCWAILNREPYFGGDTVVRRMWSNDNDAGANITTDLKQAENYFKSRGRIKNFKAVRPIIRSGGAPSVSVGINIEFENKPVTGNLSFSPTTVGIWDTDLWDSGLWGGDLIVFKDWQAASGAGTSGALRMKTVSNSLEVRFSSSDHLFEYGGVIA